MQKRAWHVSTVREPRYEARKLDALDDGGGGHAAAGAHRDEAGAQAAALEGFERALRGDKAQRNRRRTLRRQRLRVLELLAKF